MAGLALEWLARRADSCITIVLCIPFSSIAFVHSPVSVGFASQSDLTCPGHAFVVVVQARAPRHLRHRRRARRCPIATGSSRSARRSPATAIPRRPPRTTTTTTTTTPAAATATTAAAAAAESGTRLAARLRGRYRQCRLLLLRPTSTREARSGSHRSPRSQTRALATPRSGRLACCFAHFLFALISFQAPYLEHAHMIYQKKTNPRGYLDYIVQM